MSEPTALLAAAHGGDAGAASTAFGLPYDDLRRLARARLRQHQTMTLLDTTSLVHESYAKLVGAGALPEADRHHLFAYASRVMRSVIVDFARAKLAERRSGGAGHVALNTAINHQTAAPENDALRVHEALDVLAQADERLAQVVEMRCFGGPVGGGDRRSNGSVRAHRTARLGESQAAAHRGYVLSQRMSGLRARVRMSERGGGGPLHRRTGEPENIMALRRPARGPHADFDPAWFLWPALVLVVLFGAALLAGVINDPPAPQPPPAEVGANALGT